MNRCAIALFAIVALLAAPTLSGDHQRHDESASKTRVSKVDAVAATQATLEHGLAGACTHVKAAIETVASTVVTIIKAVVRVVETIVVAIVKLVIHVLSAVVIAVGRFLLAMLFG